MTFLADEGVDQPIVARLREAGHTVSYVAELEPGIHDDDVLALANEQSAILITFDKDFGDLVFRQRRVHSGVLLIRLAGLAALAKADRVSNAIAAHGVELEGAFAVISRSRLRIRRRL